MDVCTISPYRHCCPRSPAQGSSRGIIQNLSPKHWKSNMAFKHATQFSFLLSVMVGNFFFFIPCHSHNPERDFKSYGYTKFLFLIPSISSCFPALSGLPINICFPFLQKFEINSVPGESFIFQSNRKIN